MATVRSNYTAVNDVSSTDDKLASLTEEELNLPHIEEFLKLTSYDPSEFQQKWAIIIFL
jgi:hypothetical protein